MSLYRGCAGAGYFAQGGGPTGEPSAIERRLVLAHGHEAVGTLRAMLEAIAGAEQSVDPRMRAFYL
jgi:hypothetical protein